MHDAHTDLDVDDARRLIRVHGLFDERSADALTDAVTRLGHSSGPVVVDVSDTQFIDPAGIRALANIAGQKQHGASLVFAMRASVPADSADSAAGSKSVAGLDVLREAGERFA